MTVGQSTESVVEEAAPAWLEVLGYVVLHGSEIMANMPGVVRSDPSYREVMPPKLISGVPWVKAGVLHVYVADATP